MNDRRRQRADAELARPSVSGVPFFTFVGGKGGVGKSTCAAMAAVASAADRPTLLVGTDPASSLADVLDAPVTSTPSPVGGIPGLQAASLDAATAFARWLRPRRAAIAAIAVRGTYLDDEDVGRLLRLSLPGIDEIVALLEIVALARRQAAVPSGRRTDPACGAGAGPAIRHVVVDTAPTGHTLRLFAMPTLLGRVAALLDALQSHHRVVVSALRGSYASDEADAVVDELDRDGRALAAVLRDSAQTSVAWVTLPEPMALEETADALGALDSAGIHVQRLIVNRVTPHDRVARTSRARGRERPCRWCDARRRFEARALAPVAHRFGDRDIVTLPDFGEEPRGVDALRRVAAALSPYLAPRSGRPVEHRLRASLSDVRPAAAARGRRWRELDPAADLTAGVRWVLFGGKGGVGKSTCAAAAALRGAAALSGAAGRRVLLLSTDPAHSLADVFGVTIGDRPRTIPGAPPSLDVREIDAPAGFAAFRDRYVQAVDDALARIARTADVDRSAFRDLIDVAPPGIDEVIAIAEVSAALDDPRGYDLVVTDTAPTGHALRLLQTPAVLRDWTQALMAILLKYREIVGAGALGALLVQLSKRLRALIGALADPRLTRFVVVTRAARLPVEETADLVDALGSLHIAVGTLIVNALGAGTGVRCVRASRAQAAALATLRRSIPNSERYAIIGAPAEVPPPHGVASLAAWGRAWERIA